MSLIVVLLGAATVVWLRSSTATTLAEPVIINQQEGNFILHMRIENNSEGFRVLHSLEYVGEHPITITHRTPLTFLSYGVKKSDFTGSPISKELYPGDIYRTNTTSKVYGSITKGDQKVYIHCQFETENDTINIRIDKDIILR